MLEVTETALMKDTDATISRLHALKALGVQHRHRRFRDRVLLAGLPAAVPRRRAQDRPVLHLQHGRLADSIALLRTLVELGRALGIDTLAEGIEEESQLEYLREHRCQTGQGFIFSKPVEPAMIEALMTHTKRTAGDGADATVGRTATI